MKHSFVLTGAILGCWLLGGPAALPEWLPAFAAEGITPTSAASEERLAAEKAIRAAADAYVQAFNAHDAKAVAAAWTPDGELAAGAGQPLQGRDAIEREYARFFAGNPGVRVSLTIQSITLVGRGVAIERGVSKTGPDQLGIFAASLYRVVHVQQDGRWFIASAEESPIQTLENPPVLEALGEALAGAWRAETEGSVVQMNAEWALDRSYLKRTYTVTSAENVIAAGEQMIGWDPMAGQMSTWLFDSAGGFEKGTCQPTADGWRMTLAGFLRDGTATSAENIITRTNDGKLTWRSTKRMAGGVALPDAGPLEVERVKPAP